MAGRYILFPFPFPRAPGREPEPLTPAALRTESSRQVSFRFQGCVRGAPGTASTGESPLSTVSSPHCLNHPQFFIVQSLSLLPTALPRLSS